MADDGPYWVDFLGTVDEWSDPREVAIQVTLADALPPEELPA